MGLQCNGLIIVLPGSQPVKCRNYQEIKVQEQVQRLMVGTIPRSMWVVLMDDLVDGCKPGDDVSIWSGIYIFFAHYHLMLIKYSAGFWFSAFSFLRCVFLTKERIIDAANKTLFDWRHKLTLSWQIIRGGCKPASLLCPWAGAESGWPVNGLASCLKEWKGGIPTYVD